MSKIDDIIERYSKDPNVIISEDNVLNANLKELFENFNDQLITLELRLKTLEDAKLAEVSK